MEQLNKKIFIRRVLLTILVLITASCKLKEEQIEQNEAWQQKMDSTGNAMLDSIYKVESMRCNSLRKTKLPMLVDSFKKEMER